MKFNHQFWTKRLSASLLCFCLYSGVSAQAQSIDELEKLARKSKNYDEQYQLGMHYFRKEVSGKDEKDAFNLFRRASKENVNAMHMLAFCYAAGIGTKENEKEALKWYQKAAEFGDINAQYKLGACYEFGLGTETSPESAYRWYRRAADKGNAQAQYKVGMAYYRGKGIGQDYKEAVKWLRRSANQGNQTAQLTLGGCYNLGQGVEKDKVEAFKWLKLASALGNQTASKRLDSLVRFSRLKPNEISEGENRAAAFKAAVEKP